MLSECTVGLNVAPSLPLRSSSHNNEMQRQKSTKKFLQQNLSTAFILAYRMNLGASLNIGMWSLASPDPPTGSAVSNLIPAHIIYHTTDKFSKLQSLHACWSKTDNTHIAWTKLINHATVSKRKTTIDNSRSEHILYQFETTNSLSDSNPLNIRSQTINTSMQQWSISLRQQYKIDGNRSKLILKLQGERETAIDFASYGKVTKYIAEICTIKAKPIPLHIAPSHMARTTKTRAKIRAPTLLHKPNTSCTGQSSQPEDE